MRVSGGEQVQAGLLGTKIEEQIARPTHTHTHTVAHPQDTDTHVHTLFPEETVLRGHYLIRGQNNVLREKKHTHTAANPMCIPGLDLNPHAHTHRK